MPSPRLRVCFLLSTRGFLFGGLETIADHLAAGLARRGHHVTFITGVGLGRRPRRDLPAGLAHLAVPVVPHTAAPSRALGRLLHLPPLHLQSLSFFAACLIAPPTRRALDQADVGVAFLEAEAVLLSRLLDRRSAGSIHYFAGAVDLGWARADRSTRRLATSQIVAELARQHGLVCHGVLTPGVDPALLAGEGAAAQPHHPPRLLYVGRLESNKRVDWLLRVLASLRPHHPDLVLHLIGDGPLRAHLAAASRAQRLERQVVFEGARPPSDVAAALRQADLFVLPTAYESFGTAALEAMAAGLPVVASNLPALREATGGHAILLPPDDLDGWVSAIRELLADPRQRTTLAAAARHWATAFTWDAILDQFEPFVFEAAGRPAMW